MAMLGSLSDPSQFQDPIDISGYNFGELINWLRQMLLIRACEKQLAIGRRDGLIGGPVHLGAGQEAVAVAISSVLKNTDRVFGAHRSHSHLLALGASVYGLFAEVLGKDDGLSKGMGGSMHLWDQSCGFYGSVPIVAGTVPLAVGAALAAKLQNLDDVGVAYFGDGAIEEGVVHESLNLASVLKVPVIFVVENNLFASHMHISQRQPQDSTARFALANAIPSRVVDGNDVVAVAKAAAELISDARNGKGPGFIEAVTYRWYGHVDWREDIDVGVCRSTNDLANWRSRDPIKRLRDSMFAGGGFSPKQNAELEAEINSLVESQWLAAVQAAYPPKQALLDRVYVG